MTKPIYQTHDYKVNIMSLSATSDYCVETLKSSFACFKIYSTLLLTTSPYSTTKHWNLLLLIVLVC